MSFLLDPPALFFIGIVLAILNKKLLSSQITRILGFLVLILFWGVSISLFLDLFDWPLNLLDWTPPNFEPIGGKAWMLHTDVTGIVDIPLILAALLFLLYPVFLWIGYDLTRSLIDPHSIKIVSKTPLNPTDVKSRLRARQKHDPILFSAVRDKDPKKALTTALDLVGGIKTFIKPGDKVLIKPNISGGNPEVPGSYTSVSLVDELIRLIKSEGADILGVVDSDMVWTDFEDVISAQGWLKWSEEKNIPLINLRKTDCVKFDFGSSSKIGIGTVSKLMIEADVIISIPTMKTHLLTNITCGMKNMYGTIPEGDKAKYHKIGIEDVIVDINWCFTPTITIIDGTIGGEAIGPLTCKPVNYETIIVSNDVVAADSLAAFMMGYIPLQDIEHLKKAHHLEIGRGDVTFEWESFPYSHPKDGKWIRPDPRVTNFYNDAIEAALEIPTMKNFMNAASDFLLYDTATLPIFKNITPAFLGVLGDIFSGIFNVWGKLKGGRKKHQISSKIEEIKQRINNNEWPTEELKKHLLTIRTTPELEISPPLEAVDLTKSQISESSSLAEEFNPLVLLKGLELRSEKKSKAFGGLMYRVLENQYNPSERCIQYLYTWMRQKWFWSGWYNILIPLFLSSLGIIIFTQTGESSWLYTYLAVFITIFFLVIAAGRTFLRTVLEWRRTGKITYVYRHQFSLFIFAAIFSGILYELPPRWNGTTLIPPINNFSSLIGDIYIPGTSIVLLIIPIIVMIIVIQPFIKFFTHKTDFAPVFVYLRKEGTNWNFDKIRFDKFHYDVSTMNRGEVKGLIDKKRAKLAVPNSWHSMTTTRGYGNIFSFFGFIGFFLMYIFLGAVLYLYPEAVEGMDLIAIVVAVSLFFAYFFFTQYQTKLTKSINQEEFKKGGLILTEDKLRILWNLSGYNPALKIRKKLQNPFNKDPTYWHTFFDYEEEKSVSEMKAIRQRTSKIATFILGLFVAFLSLLGFYIGGFWNYSISEIQAQTSISGWILAFMIGFIIVTIAFLYYTSKLKFRSFLIFSLLSIILSWIDEGIFTYFNFWNYLEGEPISLAFAVFGWPILILLSVSFSNWILKYINLPIYKGFMARLRNSLPFLLLLMLFSLFFYLEGGLDFLLAKDTNSIYLISALICILILISFMFAFTHTFKQNLVIMTFSMIFGGSMELLGHLCGYWNYFAFNPITPGIPNFLVVLWAFRVFTLLFICKILHQRLIRSE